MSYSALVASQVALAFEGIGDLAKDLTFIPKAASSYDFSTHAVVEEEEVSKVIKAVIKVVNTADQPIKYHLLAMIQTIDMPDVSAYSSVIFGGSTYKILKDWDSNGFTTSLKLFRSGSDE